MLTDVAVVVAEPVPAFELGIVSEIFGLPRVDPDLPRYRVRGLRRDARAALRTSTGFVVTPTDGLRAAGHRRPDRRHRRRPAAYRIPAPT